MSSSNAHQKKIELKSSDGETFLVDENVAMQSVIINDMIEKRCVDSPILVKNVTGVILAKVIEYCEQHVTTPDEFDVIAKEDMEAFDKEFVNVDQDTLFDVILAANYMDIPGLLDLLCMNVANMMKGKKPDQVRKMFYIKNDYTKEQEDEIRKENPWAFE